MKKIGLISNNKGFTLTELLVVVIIISILSLVAFSNLDVIRYTNMANDAKRLSDMRMLSDALIREVAQGTIKLQNTDNKYVFSVIESNPSDGSGFVKFDVLGNQQNFKLGNSTVLPKDPKQGQELRYRAFPFSSDNLFNVSATGRYIFCSDGSKFKIATVLEADDPNRFVNKMRNDGGTLSGWYEVGTDLSLCGGVNHDNVVF